MSVHLSASLLLFAVLLGVLTGCAATPTGPVTFRTVAQGAFSGIQEVKRVVIRDAVAWEKFWQEHAAKATPVPPLPEIHFQQEMVIITTLGTKRSGGHRIEIREVAAHGKELKVTVQTAAPKPGGMTISALTAPYHFIALPRSEAVVIFHEVKESPAP